MTKIFQCECGAIVTEDELIEIDPNKIIGCGLKQGNFYYCHECVFNFDSDGCKEERKEAKVTMTKAIDLINSRN